MLRQSIDKIFSDISKNPKQMAALIITTALIILFVYFNFLLKPQFIKIAGITGKLNKVNMDIKNSRADIAKIDGMKKAVEAYNAKIGQYEQLLPTKEGVPAILESLSEMAKSANMRISGIVPIDQKDPAPRGRVYQEIPIMISAKGGYHELGSFMFKLESSGRFMRIADIHIKANKATPRRQDIELLAVTYVLLEGK